jgi:hypothetical protein
VRTAASPFELPVLLRRDDGPDDANDLRYELSRGDREFAEQLVCNLSADGPEEFLNEFQRI